MLLPDEEFLKECSTSPHAEESDFVANMKKQFQFMKENPSSSKFFNGKSRVFQYQSEKWVQLC